MLQRSEALAQYQDTIEGLELQERSAERKAAEQKVQDERESLYQVSKDLEDKLLHLCPWIC